MSGVSFSPVPVSDLGPHTPDMIGQVSDCKGSGMTEILNAAYSVRLVQLP